MNIYILFAGLFSVTIWPTAFLVAFTIIISQTIYQCRSSKQLPAQPVKRSSRTKAVIAAASILLNALIVSLLIMCFYA